MSRNEANINWRDIKKQAIEFAKSIVENYHVGLLYGDYNKLMLTDLEGKDIYELCEVGTIYVIEFANDDIYFRSIDKGVTKLFEDKVFERIDYVSSIFRFNNVVYDSDGYGIMETESNKIVIDRIEMVRNGIECIETLFSMRYKGKEMLACGVKYKDKTHGIWIVDVENKKLLEEIKRYDIARIDRWQAFAWNVKGKQRIVSCVNEEYIDIDGEKIEKTEIKGGLIYSVVPVVDENGEEWFYYSGLDLGSIRRYNPRTREVEEILKGKISKWVYALKPVTKQEWDLIFKKYNGKDQDLLKVN